MGLSSLILSSAIAAPNWHVLFVTELDFHADHREAEQPDNYTIWRHWPGEGSRACAFIIPDWFRDAVFQPAWEGRSGALRVKAGSDPKYSLWVVGVHGAHGDLFDQTLVDLTSLLSAKHRLAQIVCVGDWNVDQLPP